MRDLKRLYPHVFQRFRLDPKVYSPSDTFGYATEQEKVLYYNGQSFKSLTFKDSMIGHSLYFFRRSKQTGRSIHQRKKKKRNY